MSLDWRRVSDIFGEALEHAPGDRAAYIAEASGGDAALEAEVAALLCAHAQAADFLDAPAVAIGEGILSDPSDLPGRSVGPYRVERVLGEGGMGIVLLAEDTRLGRKVALKAVAPGLAIDSQSRERLSREAKTAASLSHPNIATVYALEEIDGELFIASEYIQGELLADAIRSGPLSLPDLLSVADQVAGALAAAHARGIVHLDLKPENIIRTPAGVVKVLDFGIARMPEHAMEGGRLTREGTAVGTPAYMSPEQLEGRPVDARSDVFSFGVVLYELATGTNPFAAATAIATAGRVLAVDPPVPSSANPSLPPAFDRISRRCLEKERDRRYRSAAELATDIEALAAAGARRQTPAPADTRVVAPPASGRPLPHGWWVLHQGVVMAVYAALVFPIWQVKRRGGDAWTLGLLLAMISAAAFNGTLRTHLLFTARFNRPAMAAELRRSRRWVMASDLIVSAVLLATAATIARGWTDLAVTLAAFGIGVAAATFIIEPATTRAVFGGAIDSTDRSA